MTCGDDLVLVDDGTEVKRVFQLGPGGGWREARAVWDAGVSLSGAEAVREGG